MRYYFIHIIFIFSLASCEWFSADGSKEAVARVGDNYLYKEDIAELTSNLNSEDSASVVESYLDKWVKEQLLLQKAEQNLSDQQLDFEEQLENYRKSLIIYTYENLLVRQKLDTSISFAEIKKYYDENQSNFELKEPVYLAQYIEFLNSAPNQDSLKDWFDGKEDYFQEKLNDYCTRFAKSCELDSNRWLTEGEWKKVLPLDSSGNFEALQIGKSIYQDSLRTVWVNVLDIKKSGDPAPVDFINSQVRSIILNRRRIKLVADVKQEIFEEATLKEKYEIY